jgi:hypothetical protein
MASMFLDTWWMYSLFHLRTVEFSAVPLQCRLYWHRLWFSIIPKKKIKENSSQVSVQARKLEIHIHDQSSVQDNLRTVDAVHDQRRGASICWNHMWRCILKDASSKSPLKCVWRKTRWSLPLVLVKCECLWSSHLKLQPHSWWNTVIADDVEAHEDFHRAIHVHHEYWWSQS